MPESIKLDLTKKSLDAGYDETEIQYMVALAEQIYLDKNESTIIAYS